MGVFDRNESLINDIDIEIIKGLPKITTDEDKILQVLTNLLGNANKFTAPQGKICIQVDLWDNNRTGEETSSVHVSVSDTGMGIPTEKLSDIFKRFHQIGNILDDKPRGTGLGLSICKGIVTANGGRIWAESEPEKGTTFTITVPLQET